MSKQQGSIRVKAEGAVRLDVLTVRLKMVVLNQPTSLHVVQINATDCIACLCDLFGLVYPQESVVDDGISAIGPMTPCVKGARIRGPTAEVMEEIAVEQVI